MKCPKCNTEWDLDEVLYLYYEDHEDAELELFRKIEVPVGGIYKTSVCISCPICEKDFELSMTFNKVSQSIEKIGGMNEQS